MQNRMRSLFMDSRDQDVLGPLCRFSSQRDSTALWALSEVSSATLTPKCQKRNLRYRVYLHGTGILTGFPFDGLRLAAVLGSPYSELKNIAQKPVCYAASRILAWICCY